MIQRESEHVLAISTGYVMKMVGTLATFFNLQELYNEFVSDINSRYQQ